MASKHEVLIIRLLREVLVNQSRLLSRAPLVELDKTQDHIALVDQWLVENATECKCRGVCTCP